MPFIIILRGLMRVILNTNTIFEGAVLKAGDELEVDFRIAQRWINKGIAHEVKTVKAELSDKAKELIAKSESGAKKVKAKKKKNASNITKTDKI